VVVLLLLLRNQKNIEILRWSVTTCQKKTIYSFSEQEMMLIYDKLMAAGT
jgi:hypothetical protein